MKTKNKGFLTLSVLLFISVFLSIMVTNKREDFSDFLQMKLMNTKKQSAAINFEEMIKSELKQPIDDPFLLNEKINQKINNYTKEKDVGLWYILNTSTKEKIDIDILELNKISKVIILKPAPNILIKRYIITNGLTKNQYLSFDLETTYSRTKFCYPKNYAIEVIVYI